MVTIQAANQVSKIWGDDPRSPAPKDCRGKRIKRLFVVYFEPFSSIEGGKFFTRVHHRDLCLLSDMQRKINEFENEVLKAYFGRESRESPDLGDIGPAQDNMNDINFGTKRCHISYSMNSRAYKFVDESDHKLSLPMIFRKNKSISKEVITRTVFENQCATNLSEQVHYIADFEPNFSLYELVALAVREYQDKYISTLRVKNFMRIAPGGGFLREGDNTVFSQMNYAIDIPILVEQVTLVNLASQKIEMSLVSLGSVEALSDGERAEIEKTLASIIGHLTVVFDPPQSNGGNTGPPRVDRIA